MEEQHVVNTQEEFDTLMNDMESRGLMWADGERPTKWSPIDEITHLPLEIWVGYRGPNKITFGRL